MKALVIITTTIALGAGTAFGGDVIAAKNPVKNPVCVVDDDCFKAGEVSFDLIGMYIAPEGSGLDDGVGGGIGLGYFFCENVGITTKAYWWDGDSAIHSVQASGVFRAPIENTCLAPFVYGGIGGSFDSINQFTAHLGGGLEYRICEKAGIFADYSYTWADDTNDWNGYTLGVRFLF